MEIIVKKTFEITDEEWGQIMEGYNESFDLHETIDTLKDGFCISNKLGYSYHCFAYSDSYILMGYTEFTPMDYKNNLRIAVGGRTYIRKEYRSDFLLFAKIVNELKKKCAQDGVCAVTAVPNHNSRDYAIRINRFIYVADLDYYILPLHPFAILHKDYMRSFDTIISAFAKGWISMKYYFSLFLNSKAREKQFQLETDEGFYKNRFKRDCYKNYFDGKFRYNYRHYNEDGVDAIYIMDFRENGQRTKKALNYCLKDILRKDKADAILFVGFLGLKQLSLFKTPKKFIPKPLPFTYYVIDKTNKRMIEEMNSKQAWDFSLMNFDVR